MSRFVPSTALTLRQRRRVARKMLRALKPRFVDRRELLARVADGQNLVPGNLPVIVVEAGKSGVRSPDLSGTDVMPEHLADHLASLDAKRVALVTLPDMQQAINQLALQR